MDSNHGMPLFRCPVCSRQFDREQTPVMPFCSVRCQQVDLGAWLDEQRGLPSEPDEDSPHDDPDAA